MVDVFSAVEYIIYWKVMIVTNLSYIISVRLLGIVCHGGIITAGNSLGDLQIL